MQITVAPPEVGTPASVRIAGDLDLASILTFRSTAQSLEQREDVDLSLDLSGVTFMDCAGLGALEEWAAAVARRGGRTVLTAMSSDVERVLSMTWTTLYDPS